MSIFDSIRRLFGGAGAIGSSPAEGSGSPDEGIGCEEALAQVYDYLDGELSGASEDQVRMHFEVCQRCYPHLQFEKAFLAVMHRAGSEACAPDALRGRIAAMLANSEE